MVQWPKHCQVSAEYVDQAVGVFREAQRMKKVRINREQEKEILEPHDKKTWPEGFWGDLYLDLEFETPKALPSKEVDLDQP